MNCLVLLSGCGVKDGSCPEEVALTYTALENMGAPISLWRMISRCSPWII